MKTYDFVCCVPYWFVNGDLHTKKPMLGLIGSNLVPKNKKLSLELKNLFISIEEGIKELLKQKPSSNLILMA